MCGRYTVAKTPEDLADYFDAEFESGAPDLTLPTYNASPGQQLPAITCEAPRLIRPLFWGMSREGGERAARFLINARSETVSTRPAFRESFRRRRCLVLADGFYEWQRVGKGKQPFRIVRPSEEAFAFAGIWEEDPRSGNRRFVILTTEANSTTRPIHDRMPVIVDRPDHEAWLDIDRHPASARALLRPCVEGELKAYVVSREVNSSKNDHAGLILPDASVEKGETAVGGAAAVGSPSRSGASRGLFD